jgi:hypothetical protein
MLIQDHTHASTRVRLPKPPMVNADNWAIDMDVYVRFCRAMRDSAISVPEQKVMVAITTVATQMQDELSTEDVALTLVELGLRAPRGAFPGGFVNRVLAAHTRHLRRGEHFSEPLRDLMTAWGVPMMGDYRATTARAPLPFRIASVFLPAHNPLGVCPEPV